MGKSPLVKEKTYKRNHEFTLICYCYIIILISIIFVAIEGRIIVNL